MDSNVTDVWSEVCRGYCHKTKPRGLNCSKSKLDFACRVLFGGLNCSRR
jgi:hypothetical protein